MTTDITTYLQSGCGRCELFDTSDCKVNSWREIIVASRSIILACGLKEEMKWGVPCYTHNGKNVVILSALKNFTSLAFFQGHLMKDPEGLLHFAGPNSREGKRMEITDLQFVLDNGEVIKDYVFRAKEKAKGKGKGKGKAPKSKVEMNIPAELQAKFDEIPELEKAFFALTPGRQRGYIVYISGAKQSKTRASRFEKYIPKILEGKGVHDR